MPIYAYEPTIYSATESAEDCCYFETLEGLSASPLQNCPTCGHQIHRAVTSCNFNVSLQNTSTKRTLDAKLGSETFLQKMQAKDGGGAGVFESSSSAGKAARLAMRHVCAAGCKH